MSKRAADTNRGKAQGPECEATALRSGQLNREYNTLDYNGNEDIAMTEQNNG